MRSEKVISKTPTLVRGSFCIAPLKKISAENPYDIRGFGVFLMLFSLLLRDLNKTTGILLSAKKDITLFSRQFAKPLCIMGGQKVELVHKLFLKATVNRFFKNFS